MIFNFNLFYSDICILSGKREDVLYWTHRQCISYRSTDCAISKEISWGTCTFLACVSFTMVIYECFDVFRDADTDDGENGRNGGAPGQEESRKYMGNNPFLDVSKLEQLKKGLVNNEN